MDVERVLEENRQYSEMIDDMLAELCELEEVNATQSRLISAYEKEMLNSINEM